jgi:hypothetical protein
MGGAMPATISVYLSVNMYDYTTSTLVNWMMGYSIPAIISTQLTINMADSTTSAIINWLMGGVMPATISASIALSAIGESSVFNYMAYYLQQILAAEEAFNHQYAVPGYAEGGIASGPESGYMAKLHGTELVVSQRNTVPVRMSGTADGYNDPETKALLKELIALTKQKQNVNLTVEDGRSFPAYIKANADEVRVSMNGRKGMNGRRAYS